LKKFFYSGIKGRYMMARPVGLHQQLIDKAFENGDRETVIDAYLDVLDYKTEL
jgi:hypothetical protein